MAHTRDSEFAGVCEPERVAESGVVPERLATVQPSVVEQGELLNALICMTGWTKEYATERGWTPKNAPSIWAGIRQAERAMDKVMGGPKPPGYFAPSNVEHNRRPQGV